jgi:hypothetical protein
MDNIENRDVDMITNQDEARRPYRTPTLRNLGNIQVVVESGPSGSFDGGGVNNSSS